MSSGLQASPPRIKKDKWLHFIFALLMVLLASLYSKALGYILIAVSLFWLAKELIWDGLLGMGTVDIWDFVASIIGVLVGAIIVIINIKLNAIEEK